VEVLGKGVVEVLNEMEVVVLDKMGIRAPGEVKVCVVLFSH